MQKKIVCVKKISGYFQGLFDIDMMIMLEIAILRFQSQCFTSCWCFTAKKKNNKYIYFYCIFLAVWISFVSKTGGFALAQQI